MHLRVRLLSCGSGIINRDLELHTVTAFIGKMEKETLPPPRIERLQESVVNRIAAGEVIQRPVNAVKEMLENSLDAGSTSIVVTCKGGGLKLLEIKDNGRGIHHKDFPILCERFTTSKLHKYEDLETIATFGFRGEALSSISHVARLSITSRTSDSECAYKANFTDGKIMPLRPGDPSLPQPCAGNVGTTINAQDLFYNMDTRRKAFKNAGEQYQKILEVVTRYAINFGGRGLSFTCKKHGTVNPDIHTPKTASRLDNIRIAFGHGLARELLELTITPSDNNLNTKYKAIQLSIHGYISNANYSSKRPVFILFINDRLVQSSAIKRMLDSVYSNTLPKGSHSFVFLSLSLPPEDLDVNVHPTKNEVHFVHEELLIEFLHDAVTRKLSGANQSRTFYLQPSLAGVADCNRKSLLGLKQPVRIEEEDSDFKEEEMRARNGGVSASGMDFKNGLRPSRRDSKHIRVDASLQKISNFLVDEKGENNPPSLKRKCPSDEGGVPGDRSGGDSCKHEEDGKNEQHRRVLIQPNSDGRQQYRRPLSFIETTSRYNSIQRLLEAIQSRCHRGIADMLVKACFVGVVSENLCLIQYGTKLLLVNHHDMMREAFYQLAIRRFSATPQLVLAKPVDVREFVQLALDLPGTAWMIEDGDKQDLVEEVLALLSEKADLLSEYFNIGLEMQEDAGALKLTHVPELIENYIPQPEGLPTFLLRLATDCDWAEEQQCFDTVATELGNYYAVLPSPSADETDHSRFEKASRILSDILIPSLRWALLPPIELAMNGTVVQVACLEELYKIFERC